MKRRVAVLAVLLIGLSVAFLGYRWNSDRTGDEYDQLYAEYDWEFRAGVAQARQIVGKETIKVERLSDQFTVPQKLTIQGTPYEIGLTIGHIGKQAKAHLPLLEETHGAANQKLADLYQRIYPEQLEVVRGVADAYGEPADQIDLVLFERDFTSDFWCDLLQHERFYRVTDFAKQGETAEKYGCSVASYYASGHQIAGRNFDLPSERVRVRVFVFGKSATPSPRPLPKGEGDYPSSFAPNFAAQAATTASRVLSASSLVNVRL
jgi:hypothetical protein